MVSLKFRFVADWKWINIYANKVNKKLRLVGKKSAEAIRDKIKQNILEGKRYDGRKVAKLLPATLRRKRGSPLVESRTLYDSIAVRELAASYKVYIKPRKGRFGSKTPRDVVARILQNGRADMRPRPFWGITRSFERSLDVEMKRVFG